MFVIKRNGKKEAVAFDKITKRIRNLTEKTPKLTLVDPVLVSQKVIRGLKSGITTANLDVLAAETAEYMITVHQQYSILASRIAISNLHKTTSDNYGEVCDKLYNYTNDKTNEHSPLLSKECYDIIKNNLDVISNAINYELDYTYQYFGFKTLEKSYLLKINGIVIERPQHLIMRVAIGIHKNDIQGVLARYNYMSRKLYTHATPTLFNAGTQHPQMSSCFLLKMIDDSIEGIYETLKRCALLSKSAGGIGVNISNIRAEHSYIKGTGGNSNGIVPMLKVFNDTAKYVDQGGGKRSGAFAVYIEPYHADILDFLSLKKNTGKEEKRCRDLFYGLWIPDLFMKRWEKNEDWSLFCPNEAKGLSDVWGEKFEDLYCKYEREGKARKTIKARALMKNITTSQIEAGMPYMLYKDACNRKSNQQNLGTIGCSNLCIEIIQYTSSDEVAVCNLASIALPKFVINGIFDHKFLYEITYQVAQSLDKIIDENYYPISETKKSNMKHRPIGIGVQGLADTFLMLKYPFTSDNAKKLNKEIFETMYYAAASASCDLAKTHGPYESFKGSPASKGLLCPDLWNVQPSDRWDYTQLRKDIVEHGMRNSLLLAPMPTATTSQILGNNECFEPYTTNIFSRGTSCGDFTILNKFLLEDLEALGLWNENIKDEIIANRGSIQQIPNIPSEIKELYKTAWELKCSDLIDMATDRAAFIDQSQSYNVFMETPTHEKLTKLHFYSWKKGNKMSSYYVRSRPSINAQQVTIQQTRPKIAEENQICKMADGCDSCGS